MFSKLGIILLLEQPFFTFPVFLSIIGYLSTVKPELLLLDDFAMKELTLQQAEDINELVDERSRGSSLVVASNRSPQDWYPLFPNPVVEEGILDRLINKAHHVMLTGKSYRPQLRPDRSKQVAEEVRGM